MVFVSTFHCHCRSCCSCCFSFCFSAGNMVRSICTERPCTKPCNLLRKIIAGGKWASIYVCSPPWSNPLPLPHFSSSLSFAVSWRALVRPLHYRKVHASAFYLQACKRTIKQLSTSRSGNVCCCTVCRTRGLLDTLDVLRKTVSRDSLLDFDWCSIKHSFNFGTQGFSQLSVLERAV